QAVTVVSNARGGYQLSVSRTAFTRGDIPLAASVSATPAGAVADLAAAGAVPTSGALNVGHRTQTVTRASGDAWTLGLALGPVPFVADGAHTSTLTYTVVALP